MSGMLGPPGGAPGLLSSGGPPDIGGNAFVTPARMSISTMLDLSRPPDDRMFAAMQAAMPELPLELQRYAAGLQPMIPPSGTPWQEEIIFDRIARDDRSIQTQMQLYFNAAQNYDRQLSLERITASEYYAAKPMGDEEPGRSRLVLSTVRDTVRATLPSLLRIFMGVENPVEFVPLIAENEQLGLLHADLGRKCTQYASWALFTANPGWMILHDILLNGLTRKVGWAKWRWGSQRAVRHEECNNLLLPQLQFLLQETGITARRIARRPMLPHEERAVAATPEGAMYLQAGGPPILYSAQITRHAARSWPVVESVMPECVWVMADADQPATARAIFHVRDIAAGELIADGLPADKVLRHAQGNINMRNRREAVARDWVSGRSIRSANTPDDPSMRIVRYIEGWCQMDTDGDNQAELIHTHAVGNTAELIRWDRCDEVPLAAFVPYREPGRIIGYSQADMVMDLQRTETRVMRAVLDSLGQSIFPRTVIQLGAVNIEDARQTAIGSLIRVTQQGAVAELTKPFTGAQALPVLEQLEAIREGRTGITRTSQGLTADSLQSTTPTAVNAQTSASQDRIDMIARTMAETGMGPLYQGLVRMLARQQDRPNVLSIRGAWVTIDPRALSMQWSVQVNVGQRGTPAERLAMLATIAGKQEQILAPAVQQGMLDTPLVGLPEYRNTLARMVETAGFSDVVSYFKELPPNYQPPPPPPPQPTTDELLAQVEQLKVQLEAQDDAASRAYDRDKMVLDDQRSRLESALTAWTAVWQTAATTGAPVPAIGEFQAAVRGDVHASALTWQTLAGTQPATPGAPPPPAATPATAAPPPQLGIPAPAMGRGGPPARPMVLPGTMPAGGPVPSLPAGLPPNAAPPGSSLGISPAAAIALRQRLMGGGAGTAAGLLATRGALPPAS
jgi:hypothetical protein